ncbi:hypothetical protein SAY87_007271 [Trapa incisa]|uniref:DNA repair metallo-beta-lactamase domain-containing protein n=1 Tax=Trapa incisa TaxID=236973 RepID=A0AAN7Q0Y9_9MYRT|nr:hypothetical protein SAY87_007271 [Trapa incisa]
MEDLSAIASFARGPDSGKMRAAVSPIHDPASYSNGDDEWETHCGGEWPRTGTEEDEDGFPSFRLLDSDDMGGSVDGAEDGGDEDESFSSSFYKSGVDWSCLRSDSTEGDVKSPMLGIAGDGGQKSMEKKMKQASLLHMWGLKGKEVVNDSSPLNTTVRKRKVEAFSEVRTKNHYKKSKPVSMRRHVKKAVESRPRACPFYKKITGTPFTVDAFRFGRIEGCSAYFLTHFHADHYGGLSKGWSHGPIYCTPLTARLVTMCLSINPSYVHTLELNKEHVIDGVQVTLLEANHCPGAALIYFRLPNGQCCLHTGDFRASKSMQAYPILVKQQINVLYLDTTYCNPRYKFPSRDEVLNYVVRITKNQLKKQPRTLIVVGAYSIGKEWVYLAIAKDLGVKIYANASRRRILQSYVWPELSERICSNPKDTPLHVLPMSSLRFEGLSSYLNTYKDQYAAVLAFRPTGWSFSEAVGNHLDLIKPTSKGNITIYGVPYSEHSSFTELQEFVQFIRPEKIIPTVNVGNPSAREKMQSQFRQWLREK